MASPDISASETIKSEMEKTKPVGDDQPLETSYFRPVLITGFAALITFFIMIATNIRSVTDNWDKYRCKPQYMLLASLFGKNMQENFSYCTNKAFTEEAAGALGPIYKSMTQFVGFLSTILETTNSLRVGMATMVGGISNVFQDFSSRFTQFFFAVRMSAQRIRSLMLRVYGTLFAVIYMGMSGIAAAETFGNTTVGRFLDTFCFAPETPIFIAGRGFQPISTVKVGDMLLGGRRCTAVFRFWADGQEMVELGGVHVSTNHYVMNNGRWVMAGDHPDARPAGQWLGGKDRPLICLNTDDHRIQIRGHIFSDYDETEAGDAETQAWTEKALNGQAMAPPSTEYSPALDPHIGVRLAQAQICPAADLRLGDQLSHGGRILGLIQKEVSEMTEAGVSPSTLLWTGDNWKRAGHIYRCRRRSQAPKIKTALIVYPHSYIETDSGLIVRDYIEVFSPNTEAAYTRALEA